MVTLAYVVCADETPLRVGGKTARRGRKEAERYLMVTWTDLYTGYLLGDRDLATFKPWVLTDLTESAVVHDRSHLICAVPSGPR